MAEANDPFRRQRLATWILFWISLLGGLTWLFADWQSRQNNPNTAQALAGQSGELVLKRNRAGHYLASGSINARPVTFLVDTGATAVSLSERLGRELGLRGGAPVTLSTANGTTIGRAVRLDRVQVGPLVARDVGAIVSPGLSDQLVLLGMSFLRRVEMIQRGDTLILRPLESGALR